MIGTASRLARSATPRSQLLSATTRCKRSIKACMLLAPRQFHHSRPRQDGEKPCHSTKKSSCASKAARDPPNVTSLAFWTASQTWKRAGVNTFRCLVGCTAGDFSAMWYLQAFHPDMPMESIMAISSEYHRLAETTIVGSSDIVFCLR